MKKLFTILLLSVLLLSIVSADLGEGGCSLPNPVRQGDSVQLTQSCTNCTYVNLTQIVYPNQTRARLGQFSMTANGTNYNYTFAPNTLGTWYYSTKGDLNGITVSESCSFDVNYYGQEISTAQSIVYFVLLAIFILLFVGIFVTIGFLPSDNTRDDEGNILKISWLKYLRTTLWMFEWIFFLAIMFVSSNVAYAYLPEKMFGNFFLMIFKLGMVLSLPIVIVWGVWLVIRYFQDREFQKLLKRGFFSGGKI